MEEYIIKSSVGVFLSYLLYLILIRNNTRFRWVRFYFIMAVAASFLMPLMNEYFAGEKQVWLQIPAEYLRDFLSNDTQAPKVVLKEYYKPEPLSVSTVLLYIYLSGLGLVLLRFLIGFFHLLFLTIKHGIQRVGPDRLVIMHSLPYPFSFLHLIFINRETLSEANHGAMLEHERVHIRQWHWLDLILLELLVAVQWFNPFAWLFRRSVKELHEYLADEEVLKQTPKLDYQMLLFSQVCGTGMYQPVNGFKSSLTKKRILMMNNQRNKKWFAVFTVLLVAIFAIQTLSRVNLAQDPPKVTKNGKVIIGDTTKWKNIPPPPPPPPPPAAKADMPPPPPPPPAPIPLFSGTNNFEKSNAAFGEFLTRNVNLPSKYQNNSDKSAIYIGVTFDKAGKVVKAEKNSIPEGFPESIKFTEDPEIISEVIKVIKTAPAFKNVSESDFDVKYAITFQNKVFKVMPAMVYYEKTADYPNKPKVLWNDN